MFQFGRFPAYAYFIQRTLRDSSSRWFPNSDICGSGLICSSPQLFAACHVLRRLPMPRHSLCALFSLNFSDNISRYCPRFLVIDSFELVTSFRLAIIVVSFTNLNGKTFISVLFTNPVWFFSIICSFAYSVFNEHLIPRVLSRELVGLDGLEPSTSRLSGARSNHLSYRPFLIWFRFVHRTLYPSSDPFCQIRLWVADFHRLVEMMGIEPMTPCLQGRCSPS